MTGQTAVFGHPVSEWASGARDRYQNEAWGLIEITIVAEGFIKAFIKPFGLCEGSRLIMSGRHQSDYVGAHVRQSVCTPYYIGHYSDRT